MTSHGLITTGLKFKLTTALDVTCMRAADALIAVSEAGARVLRGAVPRVPVQVIPNGLLPPQEVPKDDVLRVRSELGAGAGDTLIGYVGRMSPEKRPDLFLDAAERLGSRWPGARFALIGGGPLRDRLQSAARRSSIAERVVLPGLRHDMDSVYGALDVLVVPSDTEGTPRVVIEAQMRGVPVVATAVGDVPALVEHEVSGLLVSPGDAAAIAEMTARLIADRALAARLTEAARLSSGRRTAHLMARRVNDVYQRVLYGDGRSPT
jgi:glycosyltransferase involved in cell wall biosynthesis